MESLSPAPRDPGPGSWVTVFVRGAMLRCPACGSGPLFLGWFQMHEACHACGASYRREPGFYLGSIYINYGVSVIVTGALYALLVLGCGTSHEVALAVCLPVTVVFPVVFFRYARSFLLALDGSVNRNQQQPTAPLGTSAETDRAHLAALTADDGRAGCAMGAALAVIMLFGLGMAAITIYFTLSETAGARKHDDAVDLR